MYDIFISYNTQDQAVANAAYQRLTGEGFRCFLATRDIRSSDWAFDIMSALEHAKGFVVIVSKHSALSNEVMKEITLATRYSRFIFPFRTDDVQMDRAMEYHLAPFQWTMAVRPPLELRLDELTARIRASFQGTQTSGNYNGSRLELQSHTVAPRAEFTGRQIELDRIREHFESGDHCVFLCGMGGIGKSEVAKAYARKYRKEYETVLLTTYQQSLLHLIADDQSIPIRGFSRGGVNGGQVETTESYFARKMEILAELVTPKTLLILDNFDVEEDPLMEEVFQLNCHFLITTRTNFEELGYPCLALEAMDPERDLLPIMERLDRPYKPEERDSVLQIIALLDRHTYAISLTASQMKAGHIKPQKMLEMLRKEGLRYQTRSTFSRTSLSQKGTAYSYIRLLFDFSGLSAEDIYIMQCLCCAPLEGIDIDLFMELTGVDDFDGIRRLVNLNWIQQDVENDTLRLHMLLHELMEESFKPALSDVLTYFLNLESQINNAWNHSYAENLPYKAPVLALMRYFPELDHDHLRKWDSYSTYAWILNEFEMAEASALKQYELANAIYGIHAETAYFAIRVAAVYHNQNDLRRARPWYAKAKEISMALGVVTLESVQSIFKLARNDMQLGHFEAAEAGIAQAKELMQGLHDQEPDPHQKMVYQTYIFPMVMAQALIYGGRGEHDKSLQMAEEVSQQLFSGKYPNQLGNYCIYGRAMAVLYGAAGNSEKAEAWIRQATETSSDFHGENTSYTLQCLEIYGDVLVQSNRLMEAANQYKQALNRMEKYFPGSLEDITRLTEKYEKSRAGISYEIPFRYLAT